ncbi:MAG: excinuclease ABC subunit UvrC [Candidatus Eisenbacteria bacterium]|nr:excinuclease ABC subunit UvrC [Candidatus Eisenbacteria bacterium]
MGAQRGSSGGRMAGARSFPTAPARPGVYLLRDRSDRVIYVGKALNLRNRLRTYTGSAATADRKVAILRRKLASLSFIVTESETEALILESNLIKEHRPRYNVKLRDDKRYPFIKVTLGEDYPRVSVTRNVRQDGSRYFGPYTDARAMRRTLRMVRQVFPIRQCKTFRVRERPCLNEQIGRCNAPCVGLVSMDEYRQMIDELCLFLDGRGGHVVALLTERMEAASRERRFEEAAALRDRIRDIDTILRRQRVLTANGADQDAVAVARHAGYTVASVVRVRAGKLVACESLPLDVGPETGDGEMLASLLKQFYALSSDVPSEVLVDGEPEDGEAIAGWLSERAGRRVRLHAPRRGKKRLLVSFAAENAEDALRRVFEARRPPRAVVRLGEALGLSRPPRFLAAVDISNVSGALAVGTVVTFRDGRPDRSLYRRYRINSVKGSDDYAMIREVVGRHLRRARKGDVERPDLMLIDGGKGQLSSARAAVSRAGERGIALAAIAKREEEVFVPGRSTPLSLDDHPLARRLLIRARDEVHRFSVTYHRTLRDRETRRSALDAIAGVGPERKEALLKHFGSPAAVAGSSVEALMEVPGIGRRTAERIKEALSD